MVQVKGRLGLSGNPWRTFNLRADPLQPELLMTSDPAMDEQFFNGPMVTRAGIRFYAGAPLLTKEGYALGTLCVMDRLPRELPAGHKDALLTLAHLVAAQLEVRRGTR